jgi:phosphoglycerate dehydrogenase-like enzyme
MRNAGRIVLCVNHLAEREAPYLKRLEDAGFTVDRNRLGRLYTEEELLTVLPGAFATIAGGEPYTERVFAAAPELRVVSRFGVGYDKVDVAAATRHGVAVAMAFGANHESVADGAFALMSAVAGDIVARDRMVRTGGWGSAFHQGLWRATVGVVGLGRIGRAFVRRCKGFDMHVLGYDPLPDAAYAAEAGIEMVSLDDLLRRSDFVSLHAPHTPDTEDMIDRRALGLMKPTAYLINTARGALIDEDALADALRTHRIAGAGIDVFKRTPPVGSPLLDLDNIVLTPHSTGMDINAEQAMCNRCIDSILAIARDEDPGAEFVLNPEVLRAGT